MAKEVNCHLTDQTKHQAVFCCCCYFYIYIMMKKTVSQGMIWAW